MANSNAIMSSNEIAQNEMAASSSALTMLLDQICQPDSDPEALAGQFTELLLTQAGGPQQIRRQILRQIRNAKPPESKVEWIRTMLNSMPAMRLQLNRLSAGVLDKVAQLSLRESDPGVYRDLVQRGRLHRFDLDRFKRCLREGGLSNPRASEIRVIAEFEETAKRFVEGNCSVRWALAEARARRRQAKCQRKVDLGKENEGSKPETAAWQKRLASWQRKLNTTILKLTELIRNDPLPKSETEFSIDTGLCKVRFFKK